MVKIYDTQKKSKEVFKPLEKNKVTIYQCGPTVYWNQHIGNMRAVFVGDMIFRSLSFLGFKVKFVRNYTDVGHLTGDNLGDADLGEDRMEKASKRENLSPKEIARKYREIYEKDITLLNTWKPTYSPQATDHIKEMKKMIRVLLRKGFAYETDLAIYFDISKAKEYNRLSGQNIEENISGFGHGENQDSKKRNASDFALWIYKKGIHANALQTWSSPKLSFFAKKLEGFPGWHIECSAMIKKYLGKTIDIHLGGVEHISIHHTNEIAQSEAANNSSFVNYWMHYEHLLVDNKKMAKSEGTSFLLQDLIEKGFSPLSLRFLFLQAHYRSKQNFTWESIQSAENTLKKIKSEVSKLPDSKDKFDEDFVQQFEEKISDDFNTPQALVVLFEVLNSDLKAEIKKATIKKIDEVLGLKLNEKIEFTITTEIGDLLKKRKKARENKDWQESDKLRDEARNLGFEIKDTENGQEISKI